MIKTFIFSISAICLLFTSCKKVSNTTSSSTSNSTTTNSSSVFSYNFVVDGKNYNWSGNYIAGTTLSGGSYISQSGLTSISNTTGNSNDFGVTIMTDLNKVGSVVCDINSSPNTVSLSLGGLGKTYNTIYDGCSCKLEITQFDVANKIIKGTVNGTVGLMDMNANIIKKSLSGNFTLHLQSI